MTQPIGHILLTEDALRSCLTGRPRRASATLAAGVVCAGCSGDLRRANALCAYQGVPGSVVSAFLASMVSSMARYSVAVAS